MILHNRTLKYVEHPSLFQAACVWWKFRSKYTSEQGQKAFIQNSSCFLKNFTDGAFQRVCRTSTKHEVPAAHALSCRKCHGSLCFAHILQDLHIHSSTAILEYAKDQGQLAWHLFHLGQKEVKDQVAQALRKADEAERLGSSCDMSVRLVNVANKYDKGYDALEPSKTTRGMYDSGLVQSSAFEVGALHPVYVKF